MAKYKYSATNGWRISFLIAFSRQPRLNARRSVQKVSYLTFVVSNLAILYTLYALSTADQALGSLPQSILGQPKRYLPCYPSVAWPPGTFEGGCWAASPMPTFAFTSALCSIQQQYNRLQVQEGRKKEGSTAGLETVP
jgi:hypothetical protein